MDAHCENHRTDDPVFCGMGRANQPHPAAPLLLPSAIDPRVRSVVAMAPLSLVFTASSLADIKIPVAVYAGTLDRFLQPQFHAEWVAKNVPRAELHLIPNAGHYAFMDRPSFPIQMLDGDAATDPPGFDREVLLAQLRAELPVFFDKTFSQ
jgi:predicted dienelactone hydrolase